MTNIVENEIEQNMRTADAHLKKISGKNGDKNINDCTAKHVCHNNL